MAERSLYNKKEEARKFSHCNFFSKNRKGLSTVVITLILIALSMAAIVLVWGFISNLLRKQISSSEACVGNFEKVRLDEHYTCYEYVAGNPVSYNLKFSLGIGEIDVDEVLVSIASESKGQTYKIKNSLSSISGLKPVPSSESNQVQLPDKNAGLTYVATGFPERIDSIEIAPIIMGVQCEVSDSIYQIEDCALIV